MGVLAGKRCYLGGPIQYCDAPVNWRPEVKRTLTEEFGIILFDPYEDPKQQWAPTLNAAIEVGDIETMQKVAKAFVRKDLALVDRADFVISHLPHKVPTCGTHHEVIVADNACKPTLLVCPQGKVRVPAWYYGFIDPKYMFGGWTDLFAYLKEVDECKHMEDYRWSYTYGLI